MTLQGQLQENKSGRSSALGFGDQIAAEMGHGVVPLQFPLAGMKCQVSYSGVADRAQPGRLDTAGEQFGQQETLEIGMKDGYHSLAAVAVFSFKFPAYRRSAPERIGVRFPRQLSPPTG